MEQKLPQENSIIGLFKVKSVLAKTLLFNDYLVEHLYLAKIMRLRLLTERNLYERKCFATILADLREFAQVSHPGLIEVISIGRYDKYFYYLSQYVEGERLSDWLVDKRDRGLEWFANLAQQLLEVLYYLQSRSLTWQHLRLSELNCYQNKLIVREVNPFYNILSLFQGEQHATLRSFVSSIHGVHVEKEDFNLRENIKVIGQLLFGMVSAGKLEDALRSYKAAIEAQQKRKEKVEKPRFMPEVDIRLERLIVNTFRPREQGGYSSIKDIINDVKALLKPGIEVKEPSLGTKPVQLEGKVEEIEAPTALTGSSVEQVEISPAEPSVSEAALPPEVEASILAARTKKRAMKRALLMRLGLWSGAIVVLIIALYFGGLILRANHPPVAKIANEPTSIKVNTSILLDGNQSYDKDNDRLSYQWRVVEPAGKQDKAVFTVNDSGEAVMTRVTFLERGNYKIELRVFDGAKRSNPAYINIAVY